MSDEFHGWSDDEGHYFGPDEDREELDFARGICRECETWGEFQCRVHGESYIGGLRFHDTITRLVMQSRRGKRTKAGRKARFCLYAMRGF